MNKATHVSSVKFGFYGQFILDHPAVRQLSCWSETELQRTVAEWIAIAGLTRPSRVLDLGCAFGLYTIELARRGHVVTGVEYVGWELDVARELSRQAGVAVTWVHDRFPCEVGAAFDVICVINNFSLWNEVPSMSHAILERVRPGGVVIAGGIPMFPHEHAIGPWEIWDDGTIVDTRDGTGIRLPVHSSSPSPRDMPGIYAHLQEIFAELGCAVGKRGPWLVARRGDA